MIVSNQFQHYSVSRKLKFQTHILYMYMVEFFSLVLFVSNDLGKILLLFYQIKDVRKMPIFRKLSN